MARLPRCRDRPQSASQASDLTPVLVSRSPIERTRRTDSWLATSQRAGHFCASGRCDCQPGDPPQDRILWDSCCPSTHRPMPESRAERRLEFLIVSSVCCRSEENGRRNREESQAGRRGFDPRLQLHPFNNLAFSGARSRCVKTLATAVSISSTA